MTGPSWVVLLSIKRATGRTLPVARTRLIRGACLAPLSMNVPGVFRCPRAESLLTQTRANQMRVTGLRGDQ